MILHDSSNAHLSTLDTGQVMSENMFGRSQANLPYTVAKQGGWTLASDYMSNFMDGYYFLGSDYYPYYDAKIAANAAYDAKVDPNVPEPNQGQASALTDKYKELTGKNSLALTIDAGLVSAGAQAESLPYYERMLVHSAIQQVADSSDSQLMNNNYYQSGLSSVLSVINNETYNDALLVQFAYAQSAVFLQLSQSDKATYTTLSLSDQWELIYIDQGQRSAFINSQDQPYKAHAYSSQSAYSSSSGGLKDERNDMDLDAVLARFDAARSASGVDYQVEFETVFQAQTQSMDFSSIADELKGVFQLYRGVLGRAPDQDGFEYWVKEINDGYSLEQLAEGFVNSAEYQNKVGSGQSVTFDQTLTSLYNVVLEREPDTEGYSWWKDKYENEGYTLGNVATGFTWSSEFEAKVDEETMAWLAVTYGANLTGMDYNALHFDQAEIAAIQPVGTYDINNDNGYAGIVL